MVVPERLADFYVIGYKGDQSKQTVINFTSERHVGTFPQSRSLGLLWVAKPMVMTAMLPDISVTGFKSKKTVITVVLEVSRGCRPLKLRSWAAAMLLKTAVKW